MGVWVFGFREYYGECGGFADDREGIETGDGEVSESEVFIELLF